VNNLFQHTAWLYDLDTADLAAHDLRFLRRALPAGDPEVLELACGTGRVTIPLARQGYRITGLDLSTEMLAVFRAKLSQVPADVTERIALVHGNMADFSVDRRFDAVIVPFRGFQALQTLEDAVSSLAAIRRHLKAGGIVVIDLFSTYDHPDKSFLGRHVDWVRRIPGTGQTVTRSRRGIHVDRESQVLYSEVSFHVHGEGEEEHTLSDHFALRYYFRYQFEVLLASSGFEILHEYGGYDLRRIGSGSEFIFIARPAGHGIRRQG
jgi:ubiquinone/menaquinone biosynthesis C-methylase UbiE